jgi:putative transposase
MGRDGLFDLLAANGLLVKKKRRRTITTIQMSMMENGDPLENAIAERVNGILKEEYLQHYQISNIEQATDKLQQAVKLYHEHRPHYSMGLLTPELVHTRNLVTEKLWKIYYKKNSNLVNPLQDKQKPINSF